MRGSSGCEDRGKPLRIGAAALVFLLTLGAGVWAQSPSGDEGPPTDSATGPGGDTSLPAGNATTPMGGRSLPVRLEAAFLDLGWNPETLREVQDMGLDWRPFRERDVRMLDRALRYALQEEAIGPVGQARLALEICRAIREMEGLGYGDTDVARAVFAGVRASLPEVAALRGGDGDGPLDARIRSRFRHEIRVRAGQHTRVRAREGIRGDGATGGGSAPGLGPAGAHGRS